MGGTIHIFRENDNVDGPFANKTNGSSTRLQWLNFRFRRLKKGVGFHLFITTSPCGDARIFSLHESSSTNNLESKVKLSDESEQKEEEEVKEEEEEETKDDDDSGTSVSVDSGTSVSVNSATEGEIAKPMDDLNLKDQVEESAKGGPKEVLEADENNNNVEDVKDDAKQINYGNIA